MLERVEKEMENRNGRRARMCECVKKEEEEGSGPMWCVRAGIEKSVRAETTKYGDHCAAAVGPLRIGASPASSSVPSFCRAPPSML